MALMSHANERRPNANWTPNQKMQTNCTELSDQVSRSGSIKLAAATNNIQYILKHYQYFKLLVP